MLEAQNYFYFWAKVTLAMPLAIFVRKNFVLSPHLPLITLPLDVNQCRKELRQLLVRVEIF